MMPGGETVTLSNSFGVGNFGGYGNMLPGLMVPQRMINSSMPMQIQGNKGLFAPSNLSLAPSLGGDGCMIQHEPTHTADSELLSKIKDDESDDKISSDNPEGGSGEDQDGGDNRPTKKRYHRHTLHQIQEMEKFFKECPHPDEKQRQELGRELKLSTRQIKFWFQNKRTKMKVHHERHDNGVLRSENEKLKAENFALKEAARNLSCPHCGGPANLAQMSLDEQQLRIENVRLREEIERITAMAAKYIGRQMAPGAMPTSSPSASASGLDMLQGSFPPLGHELTSGNLLPDIPPAPHQFGITEMEKPLVLELAVASMEELLHVAQAGEPLWTKDPNGGTVDVLDQDAYLQRFPRGIGVTPAGLKSETSKHTGLVIMNASSLVETFMDVNRWAEMFPSIVSKAQTLEMLSSGVGGTYDNAIQLMYSEFQVPSPLIPTREYYFLRYCKRVDNLWVIVDVSIDGLRGNPTQNPIGCRRRPSGCVIQEMPSGYSKVIWVEHVEADTSAVHNLYRSFVSSGMAFGAVRWLCTLQRQCERIASMLASIPPREMSVIPNPEGRRSMLKLAERMTNNFCGGVSASSSHTWVTLSGSGVDDIRVLIRKSVDDPGRPPGIVLSAATSLWLPVPPSRVFQFLRDERYRTEWDILSNTGVVEEMFHLAKGQDPGNCVSLLRVNPVSANQNNMLILQECCTDESGSYVVYAPIDITTMTTVLNGGDPDSVALLPSGFAILPDGPSSSSALNGMAPMGLTSPTGSSDGSLLTVAFQILVDHVPTARLSLSSVATVNKLISSTVVRIKGALACEPA